MHRLIVLCAVLTAAVPTGARAGVSLQAVGGGGETTRDVHTNFGWNVGAILGLHFAGPLGLEVEYQYAENDLTGASGSGKLKQNGLLGHVRLDFTRTALVPFVYAGVGWVRYDATSLFASGSRDRAVVPAGVGLEFNVAPIVIGARGEYQWNTSEVGSQHLDYWKVVGTVGFRIP